MLNALRSNALSCYRGICYLIIFLCSFFNLSNAVAEGSKDLYPSGAVGNRAFLYSDPGTSGSLPYFPFRTEGTHYVYVQLNEYITVASSAQGIGNGSIRITSPSGIQTTTTQGNIGSRAQEIAGPRYPTQNSGGSRYLPYTLQVAEAGIWKIEFIPPDTDDGDVPDILATDNWSQSDNALIAAWDISVRNAANNNWLRGRVYTNVFNLRLSRNFNDSNKAFYGVKYVLTKDGRAYRVKNNGNNGYAFTFFSNNKGFIDAAGNPTYKSQNTTSITGSVKDPRTEDDNLKNLVTHKLFYGPPSFDLPVSAPVAISGTIPTTTWLKNAPVVPGVSDISFKGSEGTIGQASQKGGVITFKTNVAGSYRIVIPLGTGKDRVLNGNALAGINTIKWDGKDGLGNLVPGGLVVPEVRVRLASAEVHFPFIDMEINPQGIVIELTENTTNYLVNPTPGVIDESVYSDRVYWDDSNITGGVTGEVSSPQINVVDGVSSNSNGHKWGTYSNDSGSSGNNGKGQFSYGNEKAMDTYAYILSKEEAQPLNVNVKVADLQVVSVIPTFTSTVSGTQITYAVKVKNTGVSDVIGAAFHFKIPSGFTINTNGVSSSFSGATGAESNAVTDGTGFSSMLDLANGCEFTYVITGTVGAGISGSDIFVEASIMRPKDVTDPDATNTVFDQVPTDPHDECFNGTANEICNNIKYNTAHAETVCVGSSIVPIEYVLEDGGTDVQIVPALPSGLTKNIAGGKLTITGTPTASGVFTFTINTLGTERSKKTVVLTVNPRAAALDIDVVDKVICIGQSAELTASLATSSAIINPVFNWYSDAALTALLHTGATYTDDPTVNTTYYVTVKGDRSCENASGAGKAVTVTVNPLPPRPTVSAGAAPITFCDGGSVTLSSSSDTGNQWYKDGVAIPNATQKDFTANVSGNYYTIVTNTNGCASASSLPTEVTVVPFPVIPDISPAGATTFCEGDIVTLTSSALSGNQWYKNGNLIPGATQKTLDVNEIGNYTVKVTNSTGCTSAISALTAVTVNRVPKGYNDIVNTLSCEQSLFSYNLQSNVNNTIKGGNAVPAFFSWTASSTVVTGVTNGSGKTINAILINTSATAKDVTYTVTPIAETGGCAGQPFNITVHVPACVDISINKTANRSSVLFPGDKIKYTITVFNNGNANHNNVKVNDPLLGGMVSQPTGDDGNGILEKNETWVYNGTYTVTQNDLDLNGIPTINTGKIINTATVSSSEYPQSKSANAEVAIYINPSVTLVKTGTMNRDFKTMTYTFKVTNNGNVTLNNLVVTDPKILQPIVLKQTTLAPGATTTGTAEYVITNEEKVIGSVSNTALATAYTKTGAEVTDVSGTTEINDDPTVIDITRYPIAIDDFANTKAEIEVAVPVINNDRPALFPLNAATIEVKSQPTHGTLAISIEGKVTYKPNKGFFGIEKFTYKIDDSNGLGSNIALVTINVIPPDLDIPNTFTPNGDGKNDNFEITGLENYEAVSIFIYNRWGDEVYRNTNYKNEWDGSGLNDGTYFYVLKLRNGKAEETKRSWVLIKR